MGVEGVVVFNSVSKNYTLRGPRIDETVMPLSFARSLAEGAPLQCETDTTTFFA